MCQTLNLVNFQTFLHKITCCEKIYLADAILKDTQTLICRQLSRVVRKPSFCICENKDADQLRGNREADQRLCFRYLDSTIPLFPKSKISSLYPSSVAVQPGLCRTWSKSKLLVFSRQGSIKTQHHLVYCKGLMSREISWL